jgi:SpoVK/Ycf46/Vps4 family AAA+-type ATPase
MDMCIVEKKPDKPEISMVEMKNDGKFRLQSHAVYDHFEIKNLDINYGYGFEQFHNDLMKRFQAETRGLVLFHGEPGTGKTYYIRHLLRKMTANNKKVIYIPPNMVDLLVQPKFLTFLSNEITNFSRSGFFCALLIEDAEPLLASRNPDVRVPGISNLLNLTDGLLNDMLKIQIICTFNVKLKELDKALLRPGRLIARKEFKAMTILDANRLAQQLGIKHHFTKPATLAEVYSMVINKNTLIHTLGEHDTGE